MHVEPDSLPTGHEGIVPRLKKGPTIHSSAWVVPGATVLGDVVLEEESSVWYGAVLRGDINRIIIGPRSNIQDNAVVHVDTNYPTTMGELVTVGHNAVVHACRIDSEVLVGMSAIILDDVEVGARSIIGANALVTVGMKIPPGSLVLGSPANISRTSRSLDARPTKAKTGLSSFRASRATPAGVFPSRVCRSRLPSPVMTTSASLIFASSPTASATTSKPGRTFAPQKLIRPKPSPPAAPAPGSSR